ILTLMLVERRFSLARLAGLLSAFAGLVLVVHQSLVLARLSTMGILFALGALACITLGAILQKRIRQAPTEILPLQYGISLLLCLAFVPFKPFEFEFSGRFLIPLLWLGLVISVVAQLLLYRMIRA